MSSIADPRPAIDRRASPGGIGHTLWRLWSEAQPFTPPARSEWPVALRRAWRGGLVLLGLQFIGLCIWGSVITHRFALQEDFATHQQATYLIAHGVFDPFSTVQGFWYWQDHSEFLFWAFAPFQYLGSPAVLMWLQAAAVVLAEMITLTWMCELIAAHPPRAESPRPAVALAMLGGLILLANPWVYWGLSFDVHTEPFAMLFAVGAARALYQGRRTVWIYVVFCLLVGDVAASYLGAIGVSAALSGRCRCRRALTVAVLGFAWVFAVQAFGGNHGDALRQYGNLVVATGSKSAPKITAGSLVAAMVEHPGRPAAALWANRSNLWAIVSPTGVLGSLWLPVLIPAALLLGESELGGVQAAGFSQPGFQNLLLTCLGAVGTIALLARLLGRSPRSDRIIYAVSALVAINVIIWAAVWIPQVSTRWLRVSPGAARALSQDLRKMRPSDEVVAQNGVIGRFADRKYAYNIENTAPRTVPVKSRRIWFVIAPDQGIEVLHPAQTHRLLGEIAALPYVHLVTARAGVFVFLATPPPWLRTIRLNRTNSTAAWSLAGASGAPVLSGPSQDWYIASNGRPGYVMDHAYWREPTGRYRASLEVAVSGTADIELWDSTTGTLLARAIQTGTRGRIPVSLDATLGRTPPDSTFSGRGIWRIDAAAPKLDNVEVRVYAPGGNDIVDVYSVKLQRIR